MTAPWWRTGVVHQIYPRSFADADGDGVGDLLGVRRHLDHLSWLGVDALWLSPVYRSPMADAGYDVADYCDVDPVFGTLEGLDLLVTEAHARELKVLLDWVPNHTSDQHPWFVDSRASRASAKRDWYVWRDGRGDAPPNNWRSQFGGPAWTYDDATGQWYLHLFLPQQPDLNWANPDVREAMHDTLRFWLDRGVDGFRADVVHLIGKDPDLPDAPPERADVGLVHHHDVTVTHEWLRGIRDVLDEYPGERAMVGEVNLRSPQLLAPYYGCGDELHLVFNFSLLRAPWDADALRQAVREAELAFETAQQWPTWVLSNHDNPRHRTRYAGSERHARAAAVLLLTLRGTPFLYAGEELGLLDADVPPERRVDPAGRDGCRAPLPWTAAEGHGWPEPSWLPLPPETDERNVESQRQDSTSVLHLYRRLLAARRRSAALQLGQWRQLPAPDGVVAYERAHRVGDELADRRVVAVNTTDRWVHLDVRGEVEVASDGAGEGAPYDGVLRPSTALLLR